MARRIDDGLGARLTFSLDANVAMWEKEITPPGIDSGGPNDTSTLRNTTWRTMAPKGLKTLTPITATVAYDPQIYTEILAMVGINQQVTVTFPDESTYRIWGWIDKFTPGPMSDGSQPTAEITIQPSNQNNSEVETAPTFTDGTSA